jgi:hypothetical protein
MSPGLSTVTSPPPPAQYSRVLTNPHLILEPTRLQCCVGSYAAQHPAGEDRRNRQSVAAHLMSLCASPELGVPGGRLRFVIGNWVRGGGGYPALEPPPAGFAVTVADLDGTTEACAEEATRGWAESTWSAWTAHQVQVRRWLCEVRLAS